MPGLFFRMNPRAFPDPASFRYRIAITGGIAEGKSTVLGMIREAGFYAENADLIARDVLNSTEVATEVHAALGTVDPVALRTLIRSSDSARATLNGITHPRIIQRLIEGRPGFYEVPLLYETCIASVFDQVWVVTCGADEQLARLVLRYGSETEAKAMLATQLPTSIKSSLADRVFRTNLGLQTVRDLVSDSILNLS